MRAFQSGSPLNTVPWKCHPSTRLERDRTARRQRYPVVFQTFRELEIRLSFRAHPQTRDQAGPHDISPFGPCAATLLFLVLSCDLPLPVHSSNLPQSPYLLTAGHNFQSRKEFSKRRAPRKRGLFRLLAFNLSGVAAKGLCLGRGVAVLLSTWQKIPRTSTKFQVRAWRLNYLSL